MRSAQVGVYGRLKPCQPHLTQTCGLFIALKISVFSAKTIFTLTKVEHSSLGNLAITETGGNQRGVEFVVLTLLLIQKYELKYGEVDQIILPWGDRESPSKKSFRFKRIFDENVTQEEIFQTVAKPVIEDFLSGYNATIFTYGQSGSGKTYTITGDLGETKNYGLIPRTIFEIFGAKKDAVIRVTYCEIYNERIYDLIGNTGCETDIMKGNQFKNLRITMFRGVTVHKVDTAAEALDLLIKGNAKKTVAETANGSTVSRSHVIFSIRVEIPCTEDGILHLNPTLHLVDLSSAETRESSSGSTLENRSINFSLHYLEHVLLSLRRPRKLPLPYKHSRITGFLKNSLEGNSIAAVIATLSLSVNNMEQTIETCQFAERLGQITVIANPNETIIPSRKTLNPSRDLELLERQYKFLKTQLNVFVHNQLPEEDISEEEKQKCATLVESYLAGCDIIDLPDFDVRKTIYCFQLLRDVILKKEKERNLFENETVLKVGFSDVSLISTESLPKGDFDDVLFERNLKQTMFSDVMQMEEEKGRKSEAENEKDLSELVNEENTKETEEKESRIKKDSTLEIKEVVSQISDNSFPKLEEIFLVQKEIPNRPELVLCIVKSEKEDLPSSHLKSARFSRK